MRNFLRQFRMAIIATGVALVLAIVVGIVGVIFIAQPGTPNAEQRAGMLGQGVGIATMLIVAPFWIFSAAKVGQERRAALKKAKAKGKKTTTKSRRDRDE